MKSEGIGWKLLGAVTRVPPELARRRWQRDPVEVDFLEKHEGQYLLGRQVVEASPVGEERQVVHISMHDMMSWAVRVDLTEAVFKDPDLKLASQRPNAVHVLETDVDHTRFVGVTIYQPLVMGRREELK